MSFLLVVPPEIEEEIAEEFDSFKSTELALSFLHDLNVLFERIAERPLQFPVIYAAMRRALLRHHDYSVFFELDMASSRAVVQKVQSRDPALWPR
jgi:hypothetical protein